MSEKLLTFCGPCVLESDALAQTIAGFLNENVGENIDLVFKGSFDKANRTSIDSYRGPGMKEGLKILQKVNSTFNLPTLTDIHLPEQADEVASVVDYIQIPAFLCRQTDIIVAAAKACAKYGKSLKIKKGQFLAPWDTINIVKKIEGILPVSRILLTERGSSFGYNNLIVDMASFDEMKKCGARTIYDATHSVQQPGGLGTQTGGKRKHIVTLAKAAMAAGADGLFMEVHPSPERALSDSATCLPMKDVPALLEKLIKIHEVSCHA